MKQRITNAHMRNRKIVAGILAAAMTMTLVAPADETFAANVAAQILQKVQEDLPAGGVMEPEILRVESVIAPVRYQNNAALKAVTPALQQYDWDCYSTDYYYSRLTEKQRQLYERLDAACGELLNGAADAAQYKVKRPGQETAVSVWGTAMVSGLGLTAEEAKLVCEIFSYSNPQYYFVNATILSSDNQYAVGIYDKFASGADRAVETERIGARLQALQEQIEPTPVQYDLETQIHNLICDNLTYLKGYDFTGGEDPAYTQSIYGALISGETLCAGYTKLYTLMCNYFHIDCISVTSDSHGWNLVRYGDYWYMVDSTWDDSEKASSRTAYYHLSYNQMLVKDQNRSHVPKAVWNDVLPETNMKFSPDLETMEQMEMPEPNIRDTASGVTVTFAPAAGDVYYTLDGSAPTESDIYEAPIELNSGGVYVVTALQSAEGRLSSCYEIFTVRVAGGKAKISSAVNVSGNKIKVKYSGTKTYEGFEISYASKKDFRNQKTTRVVKQSATISKLKKGTTYYIRVRGYKKDVYGNYYYTPYSGVKKVKVTK